MELVAITCPSCFEVFEITSPAHGERPAELDYDCEICCRPMVVAVAEDGGAEARGLDD